MKGDGRDMAVFTEAIRIPRDQRAAFLEKACRGDEELLHNVLALLDAHDRIGTFMEEPLNGDLSNEGN